MLNAASRILDAGCASTTCSQLSIMTKTCLVFCVRVIPQRAATLTWSLLGRTKARRSAARRQRDPVLCNFRSMILINTHFAHFKSSRRVNNVCNTESASLPRSLSKNNGLRLEPSLIFRWHS